jgi:sulfur carrier protein ThiS
MKDAAIDQKPAAVPVNGKLLQRQRHGGLRYRTMDF